jgi:hypothetical protein
MCEILVLGLFGSSSYACFRSGQRWSDSNSEETFYLQLSDPDMLSTWVALLRSYAIAETYGRSLAPRDGGLYRMWRQVQIEVNQGRNLGAGVRSPTSADFSPGPTISDFDPTSSTDGVDMDASCEIHIGEILYGRTTVKRSSGAPEWHEQFIFGDLPPFGELIVDVYRERRVLKPQLLGSVQIPLNNFRRGESVEGWFPVISMNHSVSGSQVGELKLRMRVDE